jgi:hypothetical protein
MIIMVNEENDPHSSHRQNLGEGVAPIELTVG